MASTYTLTSARFPNGTVVYANPVRDVAAPASATVTDGSAIFTGLLELEDYTAHATVAGQYVQASFTTDGGSSGGGTGDGNTITLVDDGADGYEEPAEPPRVFFGEIDPRTVDGVTVDPAQDTWRPTGSIAVLREAARNPKDYRGLGDDSGATLASAFVSLGAAQVEFPFAESLDQTLDWAAIYAAMWSGGDYGVDVEIPLGVWSIYNNQFQLPPIVSVRGVGKGRRTLDGAPDNTLGTSLDFTGFELDEFTEGAFYHETAETGAGTTCNFSHLDILGPLEIDVATDNHCFRLGGTRDSEFTHLRISGFSRAFHLVGCAHIDMAHLNLLRQKTAAVSMSEGTSLVSMRRMHFANSFYSTSVGVRSGYLVFAATGAPMQFITLEDFLCDEQGRSGLFVDNSFKVTIQRGVAYSTVTQSGQEETYCVRIGPTAADTTLRDMAAEEFWGAADVDTNTLHIESGATDTLLDRVSTCLKGTQDAAAVYTNAGTGTIDRDSVLDGSGPSVSGQE